MKRTVQTLLQRSLFRAPVSSNSRRFFANASIFSRPALRSSLRLSPSSPLFSFASFSSAIRQPDAGLFTQEGWPSTFSKILIANRGEIACRVIRTAKRLGVKTVAVYSEADAKSMHVQMADEAYCIGQAAASQSYLRSDKILEVAKLTGAQAIHPGYGFLSENADFAKECEKHGVVFIGPPPPAIVAMGSKSASKDIMIAANVPVVPGYHGENQDPQFLLKEAERIGFPVLIKAVHGGGGKGMKIVENSEEFFEMLDSAKREAKNSFKNDSVLIEKYIRKPRHIEFQIFADKHGNAVHMFERDCSVQRRHQKVLEEAPAPGMDPALRRQMGKSAVDAARAVGYVGAGTVEFLLDDETGEYFFMEMNTRLQVEHPVTEMVVRLDLVQLQLHVAANHRLPYSQDDVECHGHAIEARIYAENPDNNFLPCVGRLEYLSLPTTSADVRLETGVRPKDEVSIFYDPMIAKLIVWGANREMALSRLSQALSEYKIVGLVNNIPFLLRAANHPAYQQGRVTTNFIPKHLQDLVGHSRAPPPAVCSAVLYLLTQEQAIYASQAQKATLRSDAGSPWHIPSLRRINAASPSDQTRHITLLPVVAGVAVAPPPRAKPTKGKPAPPPAPADPVTAPFEVKLGMPVVHDPIAAPASRRAVITVDGKEVEVEWEAKSLDPQATVFHARIQDQAYQVTVVQNGEQLNVFIGDRQYIFAIPSVSFDIGSGASSGGAVSPMPGKISKIIAKPGTAVKAGSPLLVMEAMKMEHVIRAAASGVVEKVLFAEGDFVQGGKTLVTFKADE
eukprot:TRINITY_DN290_c0_g1_i4.p1 TRINITY_DN290_c0_g1~~TRINITY_DN290_c0_g1_i4.p1  ORF type:complete len:808 (+),score=319.20 TRINITY_DN290_c0_g1_i4:56-2425(+)